MTRPAPTPSPTPTHPAAARPITTEAATHEIVVAGHLDDLWTATFDTLTLVRQADGTTTLTGPLVDQTQLHGVLARIRDLGLPLLALRRLGPSGVCEPGAGAG